MVAVDLAEFGEEGFDPKLWINAALDSRHPQDPIDRFISDLEESLRTSAENIADALEKESADALRRVPVAARDVLRLREEAISLRSVVSNILQQLHKAEGTSAESISAIARIDVVKRRMEAAYETLQDAAGLTQLSATVEDVFASGDLQRAAETLANMRHCLSAVGEVAEFANVRKQLEVLEDRLDEMVQPRLLDALSNRKVDALQDFRRILLRIGRLKSLEMHYTKLNVKPLKKAWDDFDSKQKANMIDSSSNSPALSFTRWLPSFYDEVLLYLEQEWKWCMTALPEDYKTLVPKVLIEAMSALGASFVSRTNIATGEAVSETKSLNKGIMDFLSGDMPRDTKVQSKHLMALIDLHNITGAFAKNVQHLFSESDVQTLRSLLKAIYSPYESFKQRYGQVERAILSSEIACVDLRGAVARGVGAQGIELSETVRRMEESIPHVIMLLESAVERCISFTGGCEVDALIVALDEVFLQYIASLQEILRSLRTVCGVDNIIPNDPRKGEKREAARFVDMVSEEEEWSVVQGALQILTVADCLTSRSSVFEASLRATLARLSTTLSLSGAGSNLQGSNTGGGDGGSGESSMAGRAALDIASLRLADALEKSRKLFNLLEQSKDPRFHALSLASQMVVAFADAVNDLVYDVLVSKVRQRLNEISRLPIWSTIEEPGPLPLPSFSAYPQPYITSVGEYLMTLPQQLEPLAECFSGAESNTEDGQLFATEWMFKVAEGATALYMEQLRGIQYLTDQGAQQLAADIEYLTNVLSALSMTIPPFLATYHTCLGMSKDQIRDLLKSDGGKQLDLPTVHLLCKIRRLSLD